MNEKVFKVVIIIGIIFSAFTVLLLLFDIGSLNSNLENYKHIYGMSGDALHWQFKSVTNYKLWTGSFIMFWLLFLILSISYLYTKRKFVKYFIIIVDILTLIWIVRSHILEIQSGFDHYPGFDPYLF